MKRLLFLLIPILALAIGAGTAKRIFLTWDMTQEYYDDTNIVFIVYTQTNAAMPVAGWSALTNIGVVAFTNANQRVEIPTAGTVQAFYVVTASNVFGESDFSAPVSTRRLGPVQKLKIGSF